MNERTKTVLMIFGLSHQLETWLRYGRDMGHMTQKFKYHSGMLQSKLKHFMSEFGAQEDEVYDHSFQLAEILERVARLDENGIKSMIGLLDKIEKRS